MRAIVATVLAAGLVGLAGAQDKKGDPTGTWKWTTEFKDQKRETTLKLKADGDKLTGTISTGGRQGKPTETKIEDGVVKGGEVSFTVTRTFNDMKFVLKYKAKVEGDALKGTVESERDGQTNKREFEGKRVKDEK
jgi:hypothetical protein